MKKQIVVTIPLPDPLVSRLNDTYDVTELPPKSDRLDADCFAGVEAVITNGSTGISVQNIAALPNLSLVCCFGAGYENIDLTAARQKT